MEIRRYEMIANVVSTTNSRLVGQSECFIQVKFVLRDDCGQGSELQLDLSMGEFNELYREMEKISNMI